MDDERLQVTKKQVRLAGQRLAKSEATESDYDTIARWRSLHESLISSMSNSIKSKLKKHNLHAVLARRLKRLASIEYKLKRFSGMQLDRMQDIAGIRIVLNSEQEAYKFAQIMQQSYIKGSRRFKFVKETDYIASPKHDGYRCIHQIYEYQDDTKRMLELQIRTKTQHLWATAVEVFGMKTTSRLKSGEGKESYKEFFKLSAELLAINKATAYEDNKEQICSRLKILNDEENIMQLLSAISLTSKDIEVSQRKSHHYFVMLLDLDRRTLRVDGYKKSDLELAQKQFAFYEHLARNKMNADALLISLDSVKLLRKAYPNYYLDTNEFIAALKSVCGECLPI